MYSLSLIKLIQAALTLHATLLKKHAPTAVGTHIFNGLYTCLAEQKKEKKKFRHGSTGTRTLVISGKN
jgi:hypothetical protein